ncbi:MAG: hypothetical protein ACFFER_04980 [Candidatus Thorarchaeota archaeon]
MGADDEWSKREKRYEKYMKIPLLRYWPDDRTLAQKYWDFIFNHAPREMYDLLSKGRSLDEIAEEFDRKRADVRKMVREYAEESNLENPYPLRARKPGERKPNGLLCLACGRPLFGRQKKWCGRDDCGGWNAVHPPTILKCISCGTNFETYVGSGYTKCESCRYHSQLRHPDVLTESEAECLVADYIRKNEAMEYFRLGRKWGETIQPDALSIDSIDVDGVKAPIPRLTIEMQVGTFKTYNPNFCARCGRITNHGQYGHCGGGDLGVKGCMKQNPDAITTCHCTHCGDYTLNDGKGVCLKCNQRNPHYIVNTA